jgi:DNA-binding NarL/FixJ family response regulator
MPRNCLKRTAADGGLDSSGMSAGMASRPTEEQALSEFLDSASSTPSALLVDGEAGISELAELSASGMTARDVAAKLVISSKTVEATLARVYRKLGITSRAELGRHMNTPGR